ncbi:hypothetical protein OsI_10120 [Oryza sativa Indica Group]|uniref:Uncharacterized protein n=2 Tax=Oryza sativa TaxID=4530 RepID=A3AED5_ORYSJ|nr:hypothetical protein OsI_10120 [Oryza sativa Indica Group]EAZ25674.1 hypothetical protein OsJ_09504 [Oryza sativa Japonica Group]
MDKWLESFDLTILKTWHCGDVQKVTETLTALAVVAEACPILACASRTAEQIGTLKMTLLVQKIVSEDDTKA